MTYYMELEMVTIDCYRFRINIVHNSKFLLHESVPQILLVSYLRYAFPADVNSYTIYILLSSVQLMNPDISFVAGICFSLQNIIELTP